MMNIFQRTGFLWLLILAALASCNRQEEGIDLSQLHFHISSPYGTHYITGKEIPFRATDENGNDITPSVTFRINGQPIQGASYIFPAAGHYSVSAVWNLGGGAVKEADETLETDVIDPRSRTQVLIDDFTGTWCVNCPRVIYHLEEVMNQTDRVIPVAIHNRGYNSDPFHFDGVDRLADEYGITAYPTPLINRREVWDEEMNSVNEYLAQKTPLGIRVSTQLQGNQLLVRAGIRFDMDLPEDTLKIVVYALENGLHADQANATQYYGGQNPIPNFEHNHVLRHAFTDVVGDAIPAGYQTFDSIYHWEYNGPVPSELSDPQQMEILVFVVSGTEKPFVINVNKAGIDETNDY